MDEIAAIIAASFGLPFQKVGTSTPVLSGGELSLSVQLCSAVVMRISPHAHPTPSHLLSLSGAHASWMYGGIQLPVEQVLRDFIKLKSSDGMMCGNFA